MEHLIKESSQINKTDKMAKGLVTDINAFQYNQYLIFKSLIFEKNIITDFSEYNTLFLLRFLRARKFHIEDTLKMFNDYLDWRKSINLDNIMIKEYPLTSQVLKLYPRGYHKTDKTGRPIYFELISKIKYNEIFKIVSEDELVEMILKDYEVHLKHRLPMCSKVKGLPVEQSLSILDVKDVSLNFALKVKDFIKKTSNISQNYYPEMLGHLFIVNTSFIFKAIWSIIKGFIDEKTKKKISIEGYDYYNKLKELVNEENIPSFFGGKCKCEHIEGGCIVSDIGPWNP